MSTPEQQPETLPAKRAPDPMIDRLARIGEWLAASESGRDDPKYKGMAAALRLYYAQELGLSPLAAIQLSVVKGRLIVGAELLRGLAARHGYRVVKDPASDDKTCTAYVYVRDTGQLVGEHTFTIEMAKTAGLAGKDNWQKYPDRMLWARASKYALQDGAPEVTLGLVTEDEAEELGGPPAPPPPPAPEPEEVPEAEDAEWTAAGAETAQEPLPDEEPASDLPEEARA